MTKTSTKRNEEAIDELISDEIEEIDDRPTLDDYEALVEADDLAPSDRRRDPLRHGST